MEKHGKNGKGAVAERDSSEYVENAASNLPADAFAERKLEHDAKRMKLPERVLVPGIKIEKMKIRLIGDSPLIEHRWSEKAKKEMLDKQMKRAKPAKEAKNPTMDFVDSLYWISEKPTTEAQVEKAIAKGRWGFPAIGFKAAAVDACSFIEGITKVEARGAFHVMPSEIDGKPIRDSSGMDLVEIFGKPVMREDMVRIGMGTADIRHRGAFNEWSAEIVVRYNARVFTAEQIVHLFENAGFSVGLGEWRPSRDGQSGMFHVKKG